MKSTFQRFMEKFQLVPSPLPSKCWQWTAALNWRGRPKFRGDGRDVYAYRWVYEKMFGLIQPPLQLDHLCMNKACVNPWHLEKVTAKENTRRGNSPTGVKSRQKYCKRGHPFSPSNTLIHGRIGNRRQRRCRACVNARKRKSALCL